MPEPITHLLFYTFVFSSVLIYALVLSVADLRRLERRHIKVLLVLVTGGFCSLLPDIDAVYNLILIGRIAHGNMLMLTHNLPASFVAFLIAGAAGYVIYMDIEKAIYVGIFGNCAFIAHLLLDDAVRETGNYYLYPLYGEPISMFTSLRMTGALADYMLAGIGTTVFVASVAGLTLFALDHICLDIGLER